MPLNKDLELSIIIPVFNSSGFLRKSFDMFERNLDYSFEVIVVDDCSNEDNIQKLKSIKERYNFPIIIIFKDRNTGPGVSRNIGIDRASGKYITFLDSDDFLTDSFFRSINTHIKNGVDCILFDYYTVRKTEKTKESIFFKGKDINQSKKEDILVFAKGGTFGKIYKREIIISNGVRFLEQYRSEDLPFTKVAIANCNSFVHIKEPLYCYYQNEESLMHNKQLTNKQNAIMACKELKKRLSADYPNEVIGILLLEYVYAVSLTIVATETKKEWISFIDDVRRQFPDLRSNAYYARYSSRVRLLISLSLKKYYWLIKIASIVRSAIESR